MGAFARAWARPRAGRAARVSRHDVQDATRTSLRLLELPVLALVPMMASDARTAARRRRSCWSALAVARHARSSSVAAVVIWKLQGFLSD